MSAIISQRISKNFITFFILFLLSVWMFVDSHVYHKSRFIHSANWFSGNIFSIKSAITDYFRLSEYNEILLWENKYLRNMLFNNNLSATINENVLPDSLVKYKFQSAKIIKNSFLQVDNYLTIDKGTSQGLEVDMGVMSPLGVVGIIQRTSSDFSSVQSVLNTNTKINAGLKKYNVFGTLVWQGNSYDTMTLQDVPRTVPVKINDTVVTMGMSHIFPKGLLIGRVDRVSVNSFNNYYDISVKLFADMTQLGMVYVIKNVDKKEIRALENSKDE